MTTTPKDVEALLANAELVAGMAPTGVPWYEPEAGALVPKMSVALRDQGAEVIALRKALVERTTDCDQLRSLVRAVDAFVVDAIELLSRASVLKDAIDEATGARESLHTRDTLPPVSEEIARAS